MSKESTAHKGSSAEQQQHRQLLAERQSLAGVARKPPLKQRPGAGAARAILEEGDARSPDMPSAQIPLAPVAERESPQ
eukprot:2908872-Rhodomonas_salina.1